MRSCAHAHVAVDTVVAGFGLTPSIELHALPSAAGSMGRAARGIRSRALGGSGDERAGRVRRRRRRRRGRRRGRAGRGTTAGLLAASRLPRRSGPGRARCAATAERARASAPRARCDRGAVGATRELSGTRDARHDRLSLRRRDAVGARAGDGRRRRDARAGQGHDTRHDGPVPGPQLSRDGDGAGRTGAGHSNRRSRAAAGPTAGAAGPTRRPAHEPLPPPRSDGKLGTLRSPSPLTGRPPCR